MSVSVMVTLGAKSYEILSRIIAQSASRLNVMDLKILHAPAPLAAPSISLENFSAELAIGFRIKPQAWPFWMDPGQSVTCTFSRSCSRCACGRPIASRVRQGNKASRLPASMLTPARKSAQIISKQ
jgi:hypothetical protein